MPLYDIQTLADGGRFVAALPAPGRWGECDRDGKLFTITEGVELAVDPTDPAKGELADLRNGRAVLDPATKALVAVAEADWPETTREAGERMQEIRVRADGGLPPPDWLDKLPPDDRLALSIVMLRDAMQVEASRIAFFEGLERTVTALQSVAGGLLDGRDVKILPAADNGPGPFHSTQYLVDGIHYVTIAAAVAAAEAAGATDVREVVISAGTYAENVTLSAAVTWTARYCLIIRGVTPGTRDVLVNGAGGIRALDVNTRAYVQIKDVYFYNGTQYQVYNTGHALWLDHVRTSGGQRGVGLNGGRSRFSRCDIGAHTVDGIRCLGAQSNTRIERTKIHDCTAIGIVAAGTSTSFFLRSCLVYKNGGGIVVTGAVVVIYMRNCVIFGNTGAGISSNQADTSLDIANTVFRSNTTYAVDITGTYSAESQSPIWRFDYNDYSGNTTALARVSGTEYATLAAWQGYTGDDAHSTVAAPGFTNEGAGTEDFSLAAGSALINAGTGASVRWDYTSTEWPDPQHPAIGAFGNRDVEIDLWPAAGKVAVGAAFDQAAKAAGTRTDADSANVLAGSGTYGDPGDPFTPEYEPEMPEIPSGSPTITGITIDQDTGAVAIAWTPADAGDTGNLYRRRVGANVPWDDEPVAEGTTSPLADTLTEPGVYEYIIEEVKETPYSGMPPSAPVRVAYTGSAESIWERLEAQILLLFRAGEAFEAYAPGEWEGRVFVGIDERRLPPRDGSKLPYVEFEIEDVEDSPHTEEDAVETARVRFRAIFAASAERNLTLRFGRDLAACLRQGLGVPEDDFTWRRGAEKKAGRFWRCEWSGAFPLRVGRVTLG